MNHIYFFISCLLCCLSIHFEIEGVSSLSLNDIPDVEKELKELNTLLNNMSFDSIGKIRPNQCPMLSEQSNILVQLQDLVQRLRGSQCEARYTNDFSYLQGLPKMVTSTILPSPTATPTTVTPTPPPAVVPPTPLPITCDDIKRVMDFMVQFSQQKECIDEVRARDLIPLVANITTRMSQMALMVPSPQGFAFALVGTGVGVGLTMLYAILEVYFNWDWNNYQQRTDFVHTVCAFYDLRRQLSDAYAFSVNDGRWGERIAEKENRLKKLQIFLDRHQESFKNFLNKVKKEQQEYIGKEWDESNFKLMNTLLKIKEILSSSDDSYIKILTLGPISLELLNLLEKEQEFNTFLENPSYFYLKPYLNLWAIFEHPEFILEIRNLSEDQIQNQYLRLLKEMTLQLYQQLASKRDKLVQQWLELESSDKNILNKEIYEKASHANQEIILSVNEKIKHIQVSIGIMQSISKRKTFDSYDAGSVSNFDILKQFELLQKYIYSKRGYGFVRYLAKESITQRKVFENHYNEFLKYTNYPPEHPYWSDGNGVRKQKACRLAHNLQIRWNHAQSAAEVAYDFIQTNVALIPPYGEWFKRILGIPIPWPSNEIRLRWQLASLNYANQIEGKSTWWRRAYLNSYGYWNIGKSMDLGRRTLIQATKVGGFLENPKYECSKYLNM